MNLEIILRNSATIAKALSGIYLGNRCLATAAMLVFVVFTSTNHLSLMLTEPRGNFYVFT